MAAADVASPMIVRPRMRIPSWPTNITIDTYLIIYADDNNSNHDECIILERRRGEMREMLIETHSTRIRERERETSSMSPLTGD